MNLIVSTLSRRLLIAASSITLLGIAVPSYAFSDDEARRAVLEIRQQMRQMNEQNQQVRIRMADEIENLRHEMAQLRGKVEKLNWEQARHNPEPENSEPALQFADPQMAAAYEGAMELYNQGQYQQAAGGFAAFIDAFPDSEHMNDIRYYEAHALFSAENYGPAAQKFSALAKSAPNYERTPDALMLLASSQAQLNDLAGAQKTLKYIVDHYSGTEAAHTAQERLELLQ